MRRKRKLREIEQDTRREMLEKMKGRMMAKSRVNPSQVERLRKLAREAGETPQEVDDFLEQLASTVDRRSQAWVPAVVA